jgi:hypothetical protein
LKSAATIENGRLKAGIIDAGSAVRLATPPSDDDTEATIWASAQEPSANQIPKAIAAADCTMLHFMAHIFPIMPTSCPMRCALVGCFKYED